MAPPDVIVVVFAASCCRPGSRQPRGPTGRYCWATWRSVTPTRWGPYLERMRIEDISEVVAEAYEVIDEDSPCYLRRLKT